jgi:exodeoxyribonuclease VII small subunit
MAQDSGPLEFEQALAELEQLVETLERGDLPLEEALRRFERGVELTRHCQTALKSAQQRVEILLRRNGEAEAAPFDAVLDPPESGEQAAPKP